MKLNLDLVRDILLLTEKCSDISGVNEEALLKSLKGIDRNQIVYTVIKLKESDLITGDILWGSNQPIKIQVGNLTYSGHELLNNIRNKKVWSETKSIVSKVGISSLDVLKDISSNVISKIITNSIGFK